MLELYHGGQTTCSNKVRLCLKEKGLQYRSHLINIMKFEHHTPEYLAINPNGVVPTLVVDGEPIVESMLINEYLDDIHPDPPLRPEDALARARMRVWTKLADNYGLPAVTPPTWAGLRRVTETLDENKLKNILERIPTKERRDRWNKVAGSGFTQDEFDSARAAAEMIVGKMDAALANGPWLMGARYTLADVDLAPYIHRFEVLYPDLVSEDIAPRTRHWLQRLRARPAAIATFGPSDEAPRPSDLPR